MTAIIRYALLLSVVLLPYSSIAGYLKGRVLDKNGEPLAFATVYVKGTTMGTTASEDANYKLQLPDGEHTVLCQFIGYEQQVYRVRINGDETVQHNFRLIEQSLKMGEVVVLSGAEDPAYAIIRKAIKKRKVHLKQMQSFQTSLYLKGVLRNRKMPNSSIMGIKVVDSDGENELAKGLGLDSNGRGVLYLCEEEADYYVKGNKSKTIIRSVKESGDKDGLGIPRVPSVINFYENNVTVLGSSPRGFVSPISDNAIYYYRYKYEGEYMEGGHLINKIKVTPRRQYEPLFYGYIYIVEKDWAIHSIEMIATGKSNLQVFDTMMVDQLYVPTGNDKWVIKSQVIYPTVTFFGLDISGHFLTVYDKQQIGAEVPNSVFKGNVVSEYKPDANKKDSSYWQAARPVELQDDEVRDYTVKDSLEQVENDPDRLDSLRRIGNKFSPFDLVVSGISYNTKGYKHRFNTNAIASGLAQYNTVEGIAVNPQLTWRYRIDTGKQLSTLIAARYGFGNKHFNLFGKSVLHLSNRGWRGRFWDVGVEGGKYVFQYNDNSAVNGLNNAFTTYFYAKNYMKLYERWTAAAFVERSYGNGLRWQLKAGFQRRVPLMNTTFYTIVGDDHTKWTANYPARLQHTTWEEHNAVLIKAEVSYTPGVKYIQYPDYKRPVYSKWPTFTARYDKGVVGVLNSKVNFDKWKLGVQDDINMKLLGTIAYNIMAGGFLNSAYVSLPDLSHFTGNQLTVSAPYMNSFQIMPYYRYSNTESLYGEAHIEYNLYGLLTNKIPFFRRLQWYLILGNNTYFGADTETYYTEAFVSLDNIGYKIFRGLRVDLVHSWDSDRQQRTGVRLGFRIQDLISTTTTDAKFGW